MSCASPHILPLMVVAPHSSHFYRRLSCLLVVHSYHVWLGGREFFAIFSNFFCWIMIFPKWVHCSSSSCTSTLSGPHWNDCPLVLHWSLFSCVQNICSPRLGKRYALNLCSLWLSYISASERCIQLLIMYYLSPVCYSYLCFELEGKILVHDGTHWWTCNAKARQEDHWRLGPPSAAVFFLQMI